MKIHLMIMDKLEHIPIDSQDLIIDSEDLSKLLEIGIKNEKIMIIAGVENAE